MQSESLTRTDSTITYITMSTLRNQANYFKIILYDLQGFFSPLDYLFSVQVGSLKDEIMITSLFLGLSLTLFTPHLTYHSPHLTPYRSFSILECPFHLFVALKIFSSLLHWGNWERVAVLGGKWEKHRR